MSYLLIYEGGSCTKIPTKRGKVRTSESHEATRITHGLPCVRINGRIVEKIDGGERVEMA